MMSSSPAPPAANIHHPMFDADPEQLIGIGRLLIATCALAAIYLDPTQPLNLAGIAYWVLAGYLALSIVLLMVPLGIRSRLVWQVLSTASDIGTVGILVHITGELESPFFIAFTFMLVSAAIRWSWAGTLTVAAILQLILIVVGIGDLTDGESELNLLIMRSAFCWTSVLLLGYFANYRSRSGTRLRELADWPHDIVPEQDRPWLTTSLAHANRVLGSEAIVVIWRDLDQDMHCAAIWDGQRYRFLPTFPGGNIATDLSSQRAVHELGPAQRAELHERLAAAAGPVARHWRAVFVSRFDTIRFSGAVLVANPHWRESDMSLLMRIVASRIAIELEQYALVQEFASAASLRERVRLARDLHDSVLQDLTAAVIQLDAAAREKAVGMAAGENGALGRMRNQLQAIQGRIRRLVNDTRETSTRRQLLADQLQMFVAPLGEQWACRVTLEVRPPNLTVDEAIAAEMCLVLSEATANAARHGGARRVDVLFERAREALVVSIADDGTGGAGELVPYPASIGKRVEELGGSLAVARRGRGLALSITLPLVRLAA